MERKMRAAPQAEKRLARGIVIQHGSLVSERAAFWAYMWTEDEETDAGHWHERVPVESGPPRPVDERAA
jgi:hypothetical protein